MKVNEARQAKLLDGEKVTWHMFYDNDGHPMALVETSGGVVRTVPATWIEFASPVQAFQVEWIDDHTVRLTPKE